MGFNGYNQLKINSGARCINVPTFCFNDVNINKIECDNNYTIISKNNGDVFGFGRIGQFGIANLHGIPPTLMFNYENIKKISCGNSKIIFYLEIDGTCIRMIIQKKNCLAILNKSIQIMIN